MLQIIVKMKVYICLIVAHFLCLIAHAQDQNSAQAPSLEYVMELRVTCDAAYSVGKTNRGDRVIIPITGGTFQGPKIHGEVLPGGADYQLVHPEQQRTELEAIYSIRTHDGVNIHVRNIGLLCSGDGMWYFRTAPHFEAPDGSPYSWLNDAIYVCVPQVKPEYISLQVWMVK